MGQFGFIPMFAMFPVINHFAREWGLSPTVWTLVAFQFMINFVTDMCYGRFLLLGAPTVVHIVPVVSIQAVRSCT